MAGLKCNYGFFRTNDTKSDPLSLNTFGGLQCKSLDTIPALQGVAEDLYPSVALCTADSLCRSVYFNDLMSTGLSEYYIAYGCQTDERWQAIQLGLLNQVPDKLFRFDSCAFDNCNLCGFVQEGDASRVHGLEAVSLSFLVSALTTVLLYVF